MKNVVTLKLVSGAPVKQPFEAPFTVPEITPAPPREPTSGLHRTRAAAGKQQLGTVAVPTGSASASSQRAAATPSPTLGQASAGPPKPGVLKVALAMIEQLEADEEAGLDPYGVNQPKPQASGGTKLLTAPSSQLAHPPIDNPATQVSKPRSATRRAVQERNVDCLECAITGTEKEMMEHFRVPANGGRSEHAIMLSFHAPNPNPEAATSGMYCATNLCCFRLASGSSRCFFDALLRLVRLGSCVHAVASSRKQRVRTW